MVAQPVKPSTSISTHAPAGGATRLLPRSDEHRGNFYSRPCGRGDLHHDRVQIHHQDFYSRPCGRGDDGDLPPIKNLRDFYSRPCGRGDRSCPPAGQGGSYFYSRPCGRGDARLRMLLCFLPQFLLTPLREGRRAWNNIRRKNCSFLLTPLREGRRA